MNKINNNSIKKCVEFLKKIEENNYNWTLLDNNSESYNLYKDNAKLSCYSLFLKLAKIFSNYHEFNISKLENLIINYRNEKYLFDDNPIKEDFLIAETRQALSGLLNNNIMHQIIIPDINLYYPDIDNLYFMTDNKWKNPWDSGAQLSHYLFFCFYSNNYYRIHDVLLKLKKYEHNDGWYSKKPNDTIRINGIMKVFTGLDVINYNYNEINNIVKTIIDDTLIKTPKSGGCNIYDYVYVLSKGPIINYRNLECKNKLIEIYHIIMKYQKEDNGFSYSKNHSQKQIYLKDIPNNENISDIHGTTLYCMALWIIDHTCNLNLNLNKIIS